MKIISWNVNGVRAVAKKGLFDILKEWNADVIGLQETKAQDDQIAELFEGSGYTIYSNSAVKKGYSGTMFITKQKPISIIKGIGKEHHDQEGRVLTAEFESFYVVNVYVPNSQNGLKRLDYRKTWDVDFLKFMQNLESKKPVISMGDFNVCHQEIDIARPKSNYNKTAGFTQVEMDGMSTMINSGLIDSFRTMHPDEVKYSWWSYRGGAREKNVGWRLDYCLVSESIFDKVKESFILNEIHGSDHCPVGVDIELEF